MKNNMPTETEVTPAQLKAGLDLVRIAADAIRDAGSIPSGHLYAMMLGHLTLAQFEQLIGILKKSGLVVESENHLLAWTGPRVCVMKPQQRAAFPQGRWS